MARKKIDALEGSEAPLWPTAIKTRMRDGRIVCTDNSVWMVRSVPLHPITDAKSDQERYRGGEEIRSAMAELAQVTRVLGKNRAFNRSAYRQVQWLTINTPVLYRAPAGHPLRKHLNEWYGQETVLEKNCVLAVRLMDSLGGGGMKQAFDSAVQSLVHGGAPLEDFDRDAALIDNALGRAGLGIPNELEMKVLDAWWNHGAHSDTPFMPHPDHLHIFTDVESFSIAERAGLKDCTKWPGMTGQYAMSFAAVESIDIDVESEVSAVDRDAAWVSQLLQEGALVVSMRGSVEPAKITREELRRNRKKYIADIEERYSQNALSMAEQEAHLSNLQDMESAYAGSGAPPTLVDASIVVGFNGKRDFDLMGSRSAVTLNAMVTRQPRAMAETWLGSRTRSNPNLLELPSTLLGASGMNDMSRVGDSSGVAIGLTERDRHMAYLSQTAASNSDGLPIALCAGATGSGKLLALDTRVPTPGGWTTIGQLSVGDEVFTRTGGTTDVSYLSPIHDNPNMYALDLDDGQRIHADFEHQFVVTDAADTSRRPDVAWADTVRDRHLAHAQQLRELAESSAPADSGTVGRLAELLGDSLGWSGSRIDIGCLEAALDMVECAYEYVDLPGIGSRRVYSIRAACQALATRYEQQWSRRSATGWPERRMTVGEMIAETQAVGTRFAIAVAAGVELPEVMGEDVAAAELGRQLAAGTASASHPLLRGSLAQRTMIADALAEAVADAGGRTLTLPSAQFAETSADLLRSLGRKVVHKSGTPTLRVTEARWLFIDQVTGVESVPGRCLTVTDPDAAFLIGSFVPNSNTQLLLWMAHQGSLMTNPQIIIDPKALELDTPIWTPQGLRTVIELEPGDEVIASDGRPCTVTAKSRIFTLEETTMYSLHFCDGQTIDADAQHKWIVRYLEDGLYVDDALTTAELLDLAGNRPWHTLQVAVPAPKVLDVDDSAQPLPVDPADLAAWFAGDNPTGLTGVWPVLAGEPSSRRLLPAAAHRGLVAERRTILAALAEAIGISDEDGRTRFDIAGRDRAEDLAEFIRTLGYRAAVDGVRSGRSWSVLAHLDHRVGVTEHEAPASREWLPLLGISEIDPAYAQCISVDSPDHSYVIAGGVVSHNTDSDHTDAVQASKGHVVSLDEIGSVDGVFDPIRFTMKARTDQGDAKNVYAAAELASAALLDVNPWGERVSEYEVLINRSLTYGVERGAQCIGQALEIADHNLAEIARTERDVEKFRQLREDVLNVATMPSARAIIGIDPTIEPLGVAQGTTLIKVGNKPLTIPEPGHPPKSINERVGLSLVRMMVYGSAMALTGRNGALHLDEAWTFLQSSRSEVERLGRLARSQQVLPILYTQRVKDAVEAGLSGYISRGLIMSIEDPQEARLACELFKLEPTPERMSRITDKATRGEGGRLVPNWNSLKPLREGGEDEAGEVIRGSVCYYADLSGERAVPVEVKIPASFFRLSSTNPLDIERKLQGAHMAEITKAAS